MAVGDICYIDHETGESDHMNAHVCISFCEDREELRHLRADVEWRRRWHTRLGRTAGEPEGKFYERLERRLFR